MITAGTLFAYQYAVYFNYSEPLTRTMVFTTLIAANIFLTLENRSFYYSIFTTLRYKNNLVPIIIGITIIISGLLLYVKPLAAFFGFETMSLPQLGICTGISFVTVTLWYEIIKWGIRKRNAGSLHHGTN